MELVNELPTWQDVERTLTILKRVRSNLGPDHYFYSSLYEQWGTLWPGESIHDLYTIVRTLLKDWCPPHGVSSTIKFAQAIDHCINKLRALTMMHESSTYSPGVAGEERLK